MCQWEGRRDDVSRCVSGRSSRKDVVCMFISCKIYWLCVYW